MDRTNIVCGATSTGEKNLKGKEMLERIGHSVA